MITLYQRLMGLRVGDVMNRQVVSVSACQTLAEAAAVMLPQQMSGAPVVDEQGRCVGMVSAVDFMRQSQPPSAGSVLSGSALAGNEHVLWSTGPGEPLCITHAGGCTIRDHMSAGVQSVGEATSLLEAARMMCAAHLHRLPVLDAGAHVLGMVSSLDIVAAVVNAIDEQQADQSRRQRLPNLPPTSSPTAAPRVDAANS